MESAIKHCDARREQVKAQWLMLALSKLSCKISFAGISST